MDSYEAIRADIRQRYGLVVKNCWIAHVKELNGLSIRQAPNRIIGARRRYPCPDDARPMIEESLQRLGLLGTSKDRIT